MNQFQVPALIFEKFPDVHSDLKYLSLIGNVNKAMSLLVDYTKDLIISRQFENVFRCMALVDSIYVQGDGVVRNAVTNIYIYSFSLLSVSCIKTEWRYVQRKIPSRLYAIYINQMMQSGC